MGKQRQQIGFSFSLVILFFLNAIILCIKSCPISCFRICKIWRRTDQEKQDPLCGFSRGICGMGLGNDLVWSARQVSESLGNK